MINLKTDIMATLTETERTNIFLWCKKNLKFIYDTGGNWVVFADDNNICYSIAKPGTGAGNSIFGNISHAKKIFNL